MARRKTGVSKLIHQWHEGRGSYVSDEPWDVARRCRRYKRSLKSGTVPTRGDGDTEAQYLNYRDAQERLQACLLQVKQLLYAHPVRMCSIVAYCNFARHVYHVCRKHDYATRRHLVLMAIDRWTAKGLDRDILLEVAYGAFNMRFE